MIDDLMSRFETRMKDKPVTEPDAPVVTVSSQEAAASPIFGASGELLNPASMQETIANARISIANVASSVMQSEARRSVPNIAVAFAVLRYNLTRIARRALVLQDHETLDALVRIGMLEPVSAEPRKPLPKKVRRFVK